ncbi:MAG TPA: YciI family protein [Gemmatimonadales bacterium]|nr:YciI family protein [Gemmatimonadales bacterium]
MAPQDTVGLCLTCRWTRPSTTRRGSTFYRCGRAEEDARFTRYPPLPVRSCPGYEVTMLFVVLMNYTRPLPDVDAVRAEHVSHLERAAGRGIVVAWARRSPPVGGVLVATAPDRETLEQVLAEDPYVRAGVASPEVVAFQPANVRGPFAP